MVLHRRVSDMWIMPYDTIPLTFTSEDGCYVDLAASACGQPGAVQCSRLAEGVDEACCPQYTTCSPSFNASTTHLRCDIKMAVLESLEASTVSTSAATSTLASSKASISILPPESLFATLTETETVSVPTSLQSVESSSTHSSVASGTELKSIQTSISSSLSSGSETLTSASYPSSLQSQLPATPSPTIDTTTPTPPSPSGPGLPVATIAGIVVAGVIGIVLLLIAYHYIRRRRERTAHPGPRDGALLQGPYAFEKQTPQGSVHEMSDSIARSELSGSHSSAWELFGDEQRKKGEGKARPGTVLAELDGRTR